MALLAAVFPPSTPGGARGAEAAATALQEASQPEQAQVGLKRKAADAAGASRGWAFENPAAVPAGSLPIILAKKLGRKFLAMCVLTWLGGKTGLLGNIFERLRGKIGDYYEPFVGGASVVIALLSAGKISGRVVLGDANKHLVAMYEALRDDVETLVLELAALAAGPYDKGTYDELRAKFNQRPTPALFLYLNAMCHSGVYRENLSGALNTPFGYKTKLPARLGADNLRALSALFRKHRVEFVAGPWADTLAGAGAGATVYLDPPYVPLNKKTFTEYVKGGFGPAGHEALLDWARNTEARVLYSNHATQAVVGALDGWNVQIVDAPRRIQQGPSTCVNEVLASNF